MKKLILISIFFLFAAIGNSQYNSNWVLGTGGGLPVADNQIVKFNNGNINYINLFKTNKLNKTSTCISDSNSNLLFYTNGLNVYDANGDTMQNGTGLSPSYWSALNWNKGLNLVQAVVAIPMPGSSTEYYLIHTTFDSSIWIPVFPFNIYYGSKLYYSVIDMSANGSLGEMVQKNTNILPATDTVVGTSLTCCRHANGRDWWLMTHGYNNNQYYTWLITPNGFQGPFKQSIAPAAADIPYGLSQCKFSPDGSKYAAVIDYTKNDSIHALWLYNFNRCNGLLDSAVELNYIDIAVAVGCEFSPNSKVLYANTVQYLYQWDLQAANIAQSKLLIDSAIVYFDSVLNTNDIGYFWLIQKAIDDKIYVNTKDGTSILHCINYPDNIGLSCNFVQAQVQLPLGNFQTIPNQVYFDLGAEVGSACDTLTAIPQQNQQRNELTIYPNPATTQITISNWKWVTGTGLLTMDVVTVTVYDVMGRKQLFPREIIVIDGKFTIDVSNLSRGVYFLQVEDKEKRRCVSKLVKQ